MLKLVLHEGWQPVVPQTHAKCPGILISCKIWPSLHFWFEKSLKFWKLNMWIFLKKIFFSIFLSDFIEIDFKWRETTSSASNTCQMPWNIDILEDMAKRRKNKKFKKILHSFIVLQMALYRPKLKIFQNDLLYRTVNLTFPKWPLNNFFKQYGRCKTFRRFKSHFKTTSTKITNLLKTNKFSNLLNVEFFYSKFSFENA